MSLSGETACLERFGMLNVGDCRCLRCPGKLGHFHVFVTASGLVNQCLGLRAEIGCPFFIAATNMLDLASSGSWMERKLMNMAERCILGERIWNF